MESKPKCDKCKCELVKERFGYNCPACGALYDLKLKVIWEGRKIGNTNL